MIKIKMTEIMKGGIKKVIFCSVGALLTYDMVDNCYKLTTLYCVCARVPMVKSTVAFHNPIKIYMRLRAPPHQCQKSSRGL